MKTTLFSALLPASLSLLGACSSTPPDSPAADLSTSGADLATPAPEPDLRADLTGVAPGVVTFLPGVTVATLAGGAESAATDGAADVARFQNPTGLALEAGGTLLVSDYDGGRVRRVTSAGAVTTIAAATGFAGPFAVSVTSAGKIVVQSDFNKSGQKDGTSGTLWTVTPGAGTVAPQVLAEGLGRPRGLCAIAGGKLAVADRTRQTVRVLDVSTGALTALAGADGQAGYQDGSGAAARFAAPYGCAALPDGSIVVADSDNHRLRRVTMAGEVTTWAGDGVADTNDGPRLQARFDRPLAVAADAAGNVYVTDAGARRVRRIDTAGQVTTLAGDGTAGYRDGTGAEARLYGLEGLAVQADGKKLYVSDGSQGDGAPYNRLRALTLP